MKQLTTLVLALSLACGDDDRGGDAGRVDGGGTCATDGDCDDGHECTIDSCGVGGTCRFDTINERCPAPQICEVGRGCVDEPSCTSDEDCSDGFECTLDSCGVGGECRNMPLNELCASVGPGSTCDPSTGMAGSGCTAPTGCAMDVDCDDGVDCTLDTCGVDMMCARTLIDERCGDGEVCTLTGCFESMPCDNDDQCDDGVFCNGVETCEPEFGCRPAEAPPLCNDSMDCTMDSCDAELDMCVFRCDGTRPECDCPAPEAPCDGIFDITPVPTYNCAFGMVNFSVSEVEFECEGLALRVDHRDVPNASRNTPLTQAPRASDGTFDVSATVMGGCDEIYRLQGTFIDDSTFEATFSAEFIERSPMECDALGLDPCTNQSWMVTGTRR